MSNMTRVAYRAYLAGYLCLFLVKLHSLRAIVQMETSSEIMIVAEVTQPAL